MELLVKHRRHKSAFSMIEFVIAIAILALSVIPIYEFFSGMTRITAVTEDKVNAEMLAIRILERYASKSFDDLQALVGTEQTGVLNELYESDRNEQWFQHMPEYAKSHGIDRSYFKATLNVSELADGLLALDVVVRWNPTDKMAGDRERTSTYALMKIVPRSEMGITYTDGEPEL